MEPTPGTYVRIISDLSSHGLRLRSVHAVERVVHNDAGHYLIVGGMAVMLTDVEPFDLEPPIVNGRPVTPNATAESVLGADDEFTATMSMLSSLFTGPTQSLQEPSLALAGDSLPEGVAPSLPGSQTATSGAGEPADVVEVPSGPNYAPHGVEPEVGQNYATEAEDYMSGIDRFGNAMSLYYSAGICGAHGLEGRVTIRTGPRGYEASMSEVKALRDALDSWMTRHASRAARRRTNGK